MINILAPLAGGLPVVNIFRETIMKSITVLLVLIVSFSNGLAATTVETSNSEYMAQVKSTLWSAGVAVMCGNNGTYKSLTRGYENLGNINDNLIRLSKLVSGKFRVVNTSLDHPENGVSQTCLTIQMN